VPCPSLLWQGGCSMRALARAVLRADRRGRGAQLGRRDFCWAGDVLPLREQLEELRVRAPLAWPAQGSRAGRLAPALLPRERPARCSPALLSEPARQAARR